MEFLLSQSTKIYQEVLNLLTMDMWGLRVHLMDKKIDKIG